MRVTNVRPYALEIPNVAVVEPGDTVEVDDALGKSLCEQPDNWQPVKSSKKES